jgi:predicted DNA-binding transcriptional regulator YafY
MKDVPSLIENAIKRSQKKIIIIKYEDNLKLVTFRAISNYRIISGDDWLKKGEITKYVRAYCHLRNAERNFRLESIQRASELKINCPASASTVIT